MKYVIVIFFTLLGFGISAYPAYSQKPDFRQKQVVTLGVTLSPTPDPTLKIPTSVEYKLPFPGILPDHPLYIFKVMRDRIVIIFTKDKQERVKIFLLMADKRLSMGKELVAEGKEDLAVTTISKGEKYLLDAVNMLKEMEKTGMTPDVGLVNNVSSAISKHEEVIRQLSSKVSGDAASSMGLSLQNVQDAGKQLEHFKSVEQIAL